MRRTIPLAAVVALTLALTACGGDPEPAASSASRPTASASASAPRRRRRAAAGAGGLYVALGDSLAAGYQPGGAELRDTAYPALTATRLEAAGRRAHPGEPRLQRRDDDLAGQGRQVRLRRRQPARAGREAAEGAARTSRSSRSTSAATTCCAACGAGRRSTPRASPPGVGTVKKNLPDDPEAAAGRGGRGRAGARARLLQPVARREGARPAGQGGRRGGQGLHRAQHRDRVGREVRRHHVRRARRGVLDQRHDADDDQRRGRCRRTRRAICTLTNICTAADIHLTDEGAATVARVLAKAAEKAGRLLTSPSGARHGPRCRALVARP